MDSARADAGELGMTPGARFVQKALAGTNQQMQSRRDNFSGNEDKNDDQFGAGGKTVADDDLTPGGGPRGGAPPGQGQPSWIRNIPAAGRFGLRRR